MAAIGDGASKLLLLWNSSEFMDETGEGAPKQVPQQLNKTIHNSWKQPSSSSKKISTTSKHAGQIAIETLNERGLRTICNTLKFSNFKMLLGRIIKQQFSHNLKNCPTFIFFTENLV
jgi:hypothetical protein